MGWLDGKVALISGGASGIGHAIACRFKEEGAKVAILDKQKPMSAPDSSDFCYIQGDTTIVEDCKRAIDETINMFGGIDCVVPNAGIFDGLVRFDKIPVDKLKQCIDTIFDVNFYGALLLVRCALDQLVSRQGNIIFSASTAVVRPGGGGIVYTCSKYAIVGAVKVLANELAPRVRVNAVALGGTSTPLAIPPVFSNILGRYPTREERDEHIRADNVMHIVLQPQDHVALYVLLASDQAKAITGAVIPSDGGRDVV